VLHGRPMGNGGALEKLADFVDSKEDVWSGEREILEGPNNAPVERRIMECLSIKSGQGLGGGHWRRHCLAESILDFLSRSNM
jgi:hypothetical protein